MRLDLKADTLTPMSYCLFEIQLLAYETDKAKPRAIGGRKATGQFGKWLRRMLDKQVTVPHKGLLIKI